MWQILKVKLNPNFKYPYKHQNKDKKNMILKDRFIFRCQMIIPLNHKEFYQDGPEELSMVFGGSYVEQSDD